MRRTPLKPKWKSRMSVGEREEAAEFKFAVGNSPCVVCGRYHWHAHHVVYKQHLPAEKHWDVRNAMPVCHDCHEAHHNGSRRIPVDRLSVANRQFARDVLGDAWEDYLSRRYSGSIDQTTKRPGSA